MDLRDTISRILLGMAFGFVMGIVMYQASGVDADVSSPDTVYAQDDSCIVHKLEIDPCPPGSSQDFGDYCYLDLGTGCTTSDNLPGTCGAGTCFPYGYYFVSCDEPCAFGPQGTATAAGCQLTHDAICESSSSSSSSSTGLCCSPQNTCVSM